MVIFNTIYVYTIQYIYEDLWWEQRLTTYSSEVEVEATNGGGPVEDFKLNPPGYAGNLGGLIVLVKVVLPDAK